MEAKRIPPKVTLEAGKRAKGRNCKSYWSNIKV